MIIIRADGNAAIGTGHIMRCLSIADAFQRVNEDSLFVVADNSMKQIIEDRGYQACVLDTDYKNMQDDLEKTISIIKRVKAKALIVDSYYVTYDYLSNLKEQVKLVYIDDVASFAYPVDVLINYNIYADKMNYTSIYKAQNTDVPKLVLGTKYVPLRNEFSDAEPIKIQKQVGNVLISTGGSDPIHLAVDLIRAIKSMQFKDGITYHFVVGAMNQDREELERLSFGMDNVQLHYNVKDMKSLMCSCDIAVSAAGSTLYEICACGVPLITYVLAENQINGAKTFEEKGLAINCGDIRNITNASEVICDAVQQLAKNYDKRRIIYNTMIEALDGKGAARICSIV